jgi:hypothetical protein
LQFIYSEKGIDGRRGRNLIRRFDLNNLDTLNLVAPEDVLDFSQWPWFDFPRKLILHNVPFLKLPVPRIFGGPTFLSNFRHIGDAIREGLVLLGKEIQCFFFSPCSLDHYLIVFVASDEHVKGTDFGSSDVDPEV